MPTFVATVKHLVKAKGQHDISALFEEDADDLPPGLLPVAFKITRVERVRLSDYLKRRKARSA